MCYLITDPGLKEEFNRLKAYMIREYKQHPGFYGLSAAEISILDAMSDTDALKHVFNLAELSLLN